MTNLDPKKNKKNELAEEQLDSVTGGVTYFNTEDNAQIEKDPIITPPGDQVGTNAIHVKS